MRKKTITAWALSAAMLFGACGATETTVTDNTVVTSTPTPVVAERADVISGELTENLPGISQNQGSDATVESVEAGEIIATAPTEAVSVESSSDKQSGTIVIQLTGNSAIVTGDEAGVVKVKDGEITIKAAGTYELSGTYNGNIEVNGKEGDVNLILNGVNLTSSDLAPLYIKKTSNTNIYLADGSVNILTDAKEYVYGYDDDGNLEDDPSACLHVKGNLTFDGTGTLVVNANYNDGIKSSQNLVINSGTFDVISAGDGISSSKASVTVNGGIFNVVCAGGSENGADHHDSFDMGGRGWGAWGNQNSSTTTTEDEDVSSKAIKAEAEIVINGGTFSIDSADDAIHSNTTVTINAGDFKIATGDDGVHADETLVINDCNMIISKSYEGLEALNIKIAGGDIVLKASDDGINAAGGTGSGMSFPGFGNASGSTASLVFDGGKVQVYAGGDGVDSNGNMEFNGGEIYVDGPTDNSNAAVDSDNSFVVKGGTLVAVGSTGMLEYPSNSSTQPIIIWQPGNMAAGTNIVIKDSAGKEILNYTASKTFQGLIYSSASLKLDETYTITAGNNVTTFKLQYSISGVSSNGSVTDCTTSGGFGGFGGFGGNRGDKNPGGFGNGQNPGDFGGNKGQGGFGDRDNRNP